MTATTPRKQPHDHEKANAEQRFSFVHDGKTYTFPEPISTVTRPGFIRRNRHRDEVDMGFTVFETLAGDSPQGRECLAAMDDMDRDEFEQMVEEFWTMADVPRAES